MKALFIHKSAFLNVALNCVSTTNWTYRMSRNPFNINQQIFNEPFFHGSPVIYHRGDLIHRHLQRMYDCLTQALALHSRICLMRFDLYVPDHACADALLSNAFISKFFASLRAKIEHAQDQSRKEGSRVHDANLRFMWAREISENGRVHFHVALILSKRPAVPS